MQHKVRPKESTKFLLNPHKGCATFQHFNGDPLYPGTTWSETGPTEFPARTSPDVTPGYLPTTVAYCRWFWAQFAPAPNRLDWSMVEGALQTARERGQTLQVRLMPHGSHGQPQLPQWYQDRYPTVPGAQKTRPYIAAVYDGPEFIEQWGNVIRDFGRRFDGHPDLESVDMSYIGPWGEGAGECSKEAVDTITAVYKEAHPRTPRVAMISGYKMLAGVRSGAGWRCDCLGDLGFWLTPGLPPELSWNHHYECYPKEVCLCGAQEAWKQAPVVFEACGVPMSWYKKGFDVHFILQQGLKFHGSVLMPKSAALPEEWMDLLAKFCNDLGYRFVFRQFISEGSIAAGAALDFQVWVENVGVAPIYRGYPFAIRLTQGGREFLYRSLADIRTWFPGDVWLQESFPLPDFIRPGEVTLHAGIVHPDTGKPKVRFAVEETDAEGWVPLGTIQVT